jgi:hypothetical protein
MSATDQQIEAIVLIAELHSPRELSDHPWAGRSLSDLVELTEYRKVRVSLTEPELEQWLASRPRAVERWLDWSEDKRTSDGFYVQPSPAGGWQIGTVSSNETTRYNAASTAVAAYILRELDYWAALGEDG